MTAPSTYPRLIACWAAALALLLLAACGDDHINLNGTSSTTATEPPSEITARMETPRTLTDGTTLLLSHSSLENGREVMTYCLEFDKATLHSRWVAFRFDATTRARNVQRTTPDPFADDPDLSSAYQIGSYGFGSPYNRGHLCASADRLYSRQANVNTFYMSNMSPMLGNFNSGYWTTLESLVQSLGRSATFADTLYVVKGGTIANGQTIGTVRRDNNKNVVVPKYYYTALLKVKNGIYSSIGFWIEHKDYGYTYDSQAPLSEIKAQAVSINRLEELTGIDFFPNLPDNGSTASQGEENVEDQLQPANWNM